MTVLPDMDDEADDTGIAVASPEVRDAMALLEWARKRGYRIPEIHLGGLHLRVSDLRQAKKERLVGDPDQPGGSIYDDVRDPDWES